MICLGAILGAGCTQPTPPETQTATPTATVTTHATVAATPFSDCIPNTKGLWRIKQWDDHNHDSGLTVHGHAPGNPIPGYSWNVSGTNGLNVTNNTFIPPTSGLAGAGGVHSWSLLTTKIGIQEFSGIYLWSWENVIGNETTYLLEVNVTD